MNINQLEYEWWPDITNYDIEQGLLLGLMLGADIPDVEQLTPDDFVRPLHGAIFSVIKTLNGANKKVNCFTVGLYFRHAFPEYYKAIGGDSWFRERAGEYYWLATSGNLRQWAKDIMREADNCRHHMGLKPRKRNRSKGGIDVTATA